MHPRAATGLLDCREAANDPKRAFPVVLKPRYVNSRDLNSGQVYKEATIKNNKAKPAERRGRKATGPRFL